MERFKDRRDAGRQLARRLHEYAESDPIVLGLPRGGVPVAAEVARALQAPMDVIVVRKVGAPGHEELAMGAVAQGGVVVRNEDVLDYEGIPDRVFEEAAARKRNEVDERVGLFRGTRPLPDVADRTVLLVDDGIATGSTVLAAVAALARMSPRRVVIAVPVLSEDILSRLQDVADDVVYLMCPADLLAVGQWYDDFSPTTDADVIALLRSGEVVH